MNLAYPQALQPVVICRGQKFKKPISTCSLSTHLILKRWIHGPNLEVKKLHFLGVLNSL